MSKLLALLLLLTGAFATGQEIVVAAAADMSAALPQLVAGYTKKTGQTVKLSFGASGNLTNQIRNGAPFDVFFSADEEYPQQLIAEGLASKSKDTLYRYAVGRLVLWVPGDSPLDLSKLGIQALLDPSVKKISISNPAHAPNGRVGGIRDRNLLDRRVEQSLYAQLRQVQWRVAGYPQYQPADGITVKRIFGFGRQSLGDQLLRIFFV